MFPKAKFMPRGIIFTHRTNVHFVPIADMVDGIRKDNAAR